MSMFSWLSRPAWQSKDAARRTEAVATSNDPALLTAIGNVLRQDPAPSVRRAALERIDDLTLVADRMSNDADPGIRERARQRFADLLVGKAPVAERARALKLVDDVALLEQVAKRAAELELRRAALERCKRPGFLAERCLEEVDFATRLELLARIDQSGTLERLAGEARTRDKRLYKAIRERLERERESAGLGTALIDKAEALCVTIEHQLRQPAAASAELLVSTQRAWAELRPRIDERFDKRFAGAIDTLQSALQAIARIGQEPEVVAPSAPPEAEVVAPTAVAVAPVVSERTDPDAALQELLARASTLDDSVPGADIEALQRRWNSIWAQESRRPDADQDLLAQFNQRLAALRAADHARALAVEARRVDAETALKALDEALEANQLTAARAARATLQNAIQALPDSVAKGLSRRLGGLDQRVEKLVQWQRWSDNKVRVRLCEDVEALVGSGMHPDALANRVADLKAAWKRLDDAEAVPGVAATESGLAKRFRFLCHRALEPARPYFEKRKEVRGRRSEELGTFIERARGLLQNTETPNAELIALKREVGDHLRRVDEVDPKLRADSGKQLRGLIEQISATIDGRFNAVAEEKQKLIAQLRRQLTHAELPAALDLAKSAQKRWQTLGKGSQKTDQALWTEFRGLIDPLFDQRNEELKAVDAETAAERASAQALSAELAALAGRDELDAAHLEAEIARVEESWRSQPRPRDLERDYESALSQAQAGVAARRRREQDARFARVTDLVARLDALEAARLEGSADDNELEACAAALVGLDQAIAGALRTRIERLRSAQIDPSVLSEQLARGERLVLEYEFLAGVESPASEQSARLNLQVEKLSARMSTGLSLAPEQERASLDLRWWALGPLSRADRARLGARRARAVG